MAKKNHVSAEKVDEVERLRQVRRSIAEQFATVDEFFDFLIELDAKAKKQGRKFVTPRKNRRRPAVTSRRAPLTKKNSAPRKRS